MWKFSADTAERVIGCEAEVGGEYLDSNGILIMF